MSGSKNNGYALAMLIALTVSFLANNGIAVQQSATQDPDAQEKFSRADKLRGSVTSEREWWDLKHYHLAIEVSPETKTLKGSNIIRFEALKPGQKMQIDLQTPLEITHVTHGDQALEFEREGNVYWLSFPKPIAKGETAEIKIEYGGVPTESVRPPWSGGLSWKKDEKGNDFIATTCQGIGASIWWPCKDHGYDEPDYGMKIDITVPEKLTAVSNGRLLKTDHDKDSKTKTFHWQVTHPINNYGVNMNIGNYVHFADRYEGEGGTLDMDYWVLEHQRERAMKQFKEAPRTIKAFEHWFGKYPFYEDSYKLVVVPYLGMEHQSSVTYGNGFQNGYRGSDLSATGVGLKFDFIIVHESGHEWFGNNISMKDVADMWIHESFTNYSENLFVEYHFSKKEAEDYVIGCRKRIANRSPIIGVYGVNKEGSGDMYYKGGNMLHTIRHMVNDDDKWRSILRGLNKEFWHQTVTTQQVEDYMTEKSGVELGKVFDQYLRSTKIPIVKYRPDGKTVSLWFENAVDGLECPVAIEVNGKTKRVTISEKPVEIKLDSDFEELQVDRNFYMKCERDE